MFSAYCLQNNDYFHTGRNSSTRQECEEEIVYFLVEGEPEDEYTPWSELPNWEILEMFEVNIVEHQEPIPEEVV